MRWGSRHRVQSAAMAARVGNLGGSAGTKLEWLFPEKLGEEHWVLIWWGPKILSGNRREEMPSIRG